jgi:hypothetical protein
MTAVRITDASTITTDNVGSESPIAVVVAFYDLVRLPTKYHDGQATSEHHLPNAISPLLDIEFDRRYQRSLSATPTSLDEDRDAMLWNPRVPRLTNRDVRAVDQALASIWNGSEMNGWDRP